MKSDKNCSPKSINLQFFEDISIEQTELVTGGLLIVTIGIDQETGERVVFVGAKEVGRY